MLLAYVIYDYVSNKCKQAGKLFRSIANEADNRKLTEDDQYRLEENNVIWNGDTFLASLIGFFITRYYESSLAEDKDLVLTQHLMPQISQKSSKALDHLYELARETIVQAYMFGKRSVKTPNLYTPRRFYYQEDTNGILVEMARAKNLHPLSEVLTTLRK